MYRRREEEKHLDSNLHFSYNNANDIAIRRTPFCFFFFHYYCMSVMSSLLILLLFKIRFLNNAKNVAVDTVMIRKNRRRSMRLSNTKTTRHFFAFRVALFSRSCNNNPWRKNCFSSSNHLKSINIFMIYCQGASCIFLLKSEPYSSFFSCYYNPHIYIPLSCMHLGSQTSASSSSCVFWICQQE